MKTIILGLGMVLCVLTFTGCEKEEYCNCGQVRADWIDDNGYALWVRNLCSGNYKTFYVSSSVWMNKYEGDNYCSHEVNQW